MKKSSKTTENKKAASTSKATKAVPKKAEAKTKTPEILHSLKTRTEVRLMSKKSERFVVIVGKSKFVKTPSEKSNAKKGDYDFGITDLEDPKNPRRNYQIADESKFITIIMNRAYYQQQEKGIKVPMLVIEQQDEPDTAPKEEAKAEDKKEKKVAEKA